MDTRTRNKLFPLVGGMTAAATAAGGMAAVAHVAPAGAADSSATSALGPATPAGEAGVLESCSAYFGYGKDDAALGLVEFDVADVNGADGADHGVDMDGDGDTDVVLVVEFDEAGTIECVPEELTEDMWDDEHGGDEGEIPPYPGPGHYVYPSVNIPRDGDQPLSAGFRVTGIPGEHTLVSPEDYHELDDVFLNIEDLFFDGVMDPRVPAFLEAELGAPAADAFVAAFEACTSGGDPDFTDTDLIDALLRLEEHTGIETLPGDPTTGDCFDVEILSAFGSLYRGLWESVDYVEPIRLSVPEDPAAPTPPPAAAPVTAAPTFTG